MPENADFAERMVRGPLKMVRAPDAGHFILWNQPDLIAREILAMLDSLEQPPRALCRYNRPAPAPADPDTGK